MDHAKQETNTVTYGWYICGTRQNKKAGILALSII
jgi:hypothetical protein